MATILTKKSDTSSSVPLAADLTNAAGGAELAVNTADKRLYSKTSGGSVVELGTNPSALSLPNGTANGVAYLNGSKVLTSGSALQFQNGNLLVGTTTDVGWRLNVEQAGANALRHLNTSGFGATILLADQGNSATISQNSGAVITSIGGSEQMRLTSTGLGIGTSSPDAGVRLTVAKNDGIIQIQRATGSAYPFSFGIASDGRFNIYNGTTASESLAITQSGNLGLGVTPSGWDGTVAGPLVFGTSGKGSLSYAGGATALGDNFYRNSAGFRYATTGAASLYQLYAGTHSWYTSPSGTAGNATAFTQAMTLDASSRLSVGTTSVNGGQFTVGGNMGPSTDNISTCANAFYRWSVVYAATGTINTSDAREKTQVRSLNEAEIAAAQQIASEIGAYKWLSAVAEKGDAAREHIGMTVQRAIEIMEASGLAPFNYGFICYDENEETSRYSFRMDELALFISRGQQAIIDQLKARLDAANI